MAEVFFLAVMTYDDKLFNPKALKFALEVGALLYSHRANTLLDYIQIDCAVNAGGSSR